MPEVIYTIGHGTATAEGFSGRLREQGVTQLVDIRSFPGSRRNPQFGRLQMAHWVPAAGIDYRWIQELGGRRRSLAESPHQALRHPAFRSYADHMETDTFDHGLSGLLALATEQPTAIMCSESLWWRCHRRLVSDHLVLIEGRAVRHIMPNGSVTDHPPLREARVHGDHLVYDGSTLEP